MRVVVNNNQPNRVNISSSNNVTVKVQPTSETRVVVGQSDTTGALMIANNFSDVPNVKTARNNLGLGTMSLKTSGAYVTAEGDRRFNRIAVRDFPRITVFDAGQISNSTVHDLTTDIYGVYKAKSPSGPGLGVTFNLTFSDNNDLFNPAPLGTALFFRVILEEFNSVSTSFTSAGKGSNIKWEGGSEPTFSGAGKIDIFEFMSVDGGTVWYAKMLYSNITA